MGKLLFTKQPLHFFIMKCVCSKFFYWSLP